MKVSACFRHVCASMVHLSAEPGDAVKGYRDYLAGEFSAVKGMTAAVGLDRTMAQAGLAFKYR